MQLLSRSVHAGPLFEGRGAAFAAASPHVRNAAAQPSEHAPPGSFASVLAVEDAGDAGRAEALGPGAAVADAPAADAAGTVPSAPLEPPP